MYSFAILILSLTMMVLSQSCNDLEGDVPIEVNDAETIYVKACITNASFPNEVVNLLNIDCSNADGLKEIEELPVHFMTFLKNLNELIIQCSVKYIRAGAFSNLPALKDVDLSGNQLRNVSAGVFNLIPSLQYLNISKNALLFIEDLSFANLPRLADLDLSYNRLDYMSRSWFVNTSTIEEFYINNNALTEIPKNMFNGWIKSYAFNFDYNDISKIQDGAFRDAAPEINYLSFHHNRLSSLNLNAFPQRDMTIAQLDISSNLFNYLPPEFFKGIAVKNIWIFGNPFECTCLKNTETALVARRVKINRVQSMMSAKKGCHFDVPACVVATTSPPVCNETEDTELTNRMTNHIRTLEFMDLKDWYEQCVTLSRKAYLDT